MIAIAVLTFNRLSVLTQVLGALQEHCGHCKIGVFEDAGIKDTTQAWAQQSWKVKSACSNLMAVKLTESSAFPSVEFFLGTENLGVAGNSNRAIRWFMESGCDYLCLMNDDVLAKGDFTKIYYDAWKSTGIGLFCFCGIFSPGYECQDIQIKSKSGEMIRLKLLRRLTGSMMAVPKELIKDIGYLDVRFGKFGEEHCCWTTRADIAGYQDIGSQTWRGIDLHHDLLVQMDVPTTMVGPEKVQNEEAAAKFTAAIDYIKDGIYRPFKLKPDEICSGIENMGISEAQLEGYHRLPEVLNQAILTG